MNYYILFRSYCTNNQHHLIIKMISSQQETHTFRVTVHLLEVKMAIKFPCSLLFHLKSDSGSIDSSKALRQLKNGKCQPNQKLICQIEILVNNLHYFDKSITITMQMISKNGKIPAGTIPFNLAESGKIIQRTNRQIFTIQKCPDKTATLQAIVKIDLIRSEKKENRTGQGSNSLRLKLGGSSNYETLQSPGYRSQLRTPDKNINLLLTQSKIYKKPKQSPRDWLQKQESFQKQQIQFQFQKSQLLKSVGHKRGRSQDKFVKQIQTLKSQIQSMRRQQVYKTDTIQDKLAKYKNEIEYYSQQHCTLRQKIKQYQRRQKDLVHYNKDIKDKYQKIKIKLQHFVHNQETIKQQLTNKQLLIKRLQNELKLSQQQLQQTTININTLSRKYEIKQTINKQQICKLTQKLQQCQIEYHNSYSNFNNKLIEYQIEEKKVQSQNKQKDRMYNEDKNKYIKQNQALKYEICVIGDSKDEIGNLLRQSLIQCQNMNKDNIRLISENKQYGIRCEILQSDCKKYIRQIQSLNKRVKQIDEMKDELYLGNNKLKELQANNVKYQEQLNKIINKAELYAKTITNLETTLKTTQNTRDDLNNKVSELYKQIYKFNSILQHKNLEEFKFKTQIQTLSTKLAEIKTRYDVQKHELKTLKAKAESQVVYLLHTNTQMELEIDELKDKLTKSDEVVAGQTTKIYDLQDKQLKINQQILSWHEKVSTGEQVINFLQNKIKWLQQITQQKDIKDKQINQLLKQKCNNEFNLYNQIKEREQQIYILQQKSKQSQNNNRDTINQIQITIKQKDKVIQDLQKLLLIRSQNQHVLKEKLQSMQSQVQGFIKQKQGNKNQIGSLQIVIESANVYAKDIQTKIHDLGEKLAESNIRQNILKGQLNQKSGALQIIRKQWEQYRKVSYCAMSGFFGEIGKIRGLEDERNRQQGQGQSETIKSQIQLLSFPDEEISALQIQALRKNHQQFQKMSDQITKYTMENGILEQNAIREKNRFIQKQTDLISQLDKQKLRIQQMQIQSANKQQQSAFKLLVLEERLMQMQKEVHLLSEAKNQMSDLIISQRQNKDRLCEQSNKYLLQISQNNKQINQLKKILTQHLSLNQTEAHGLAEEYKMQINVLNTTIREIQKRCAHQSSQISGLEERLTKNNQQLADMTRLKQKSQRKLEVSALKNEQIVIMVGNLQEDLNVSSRKNSELNSELSFLQEENRKQKNKIVELTINLNKTKCELIETDNNFVLNKNKADSIAGLVEEKQAKIIQIQREYHLRIEKSHEQLKELREKVIQLKSEVDFKEFINLQHQKTITEYKNHCIEYQQQISDKKSTIIGFGEEIQKLKSEAILLQQKYESGMQLQLRFEQELKKQTEKVEDLNNQVMENTVYSELLNAREAEYQRLLEHFNGLENKYNQLGINSREGINELKKQVILHTSREQELKRKIRDIQRDFEQKLCQLQQQTEFNKNEIEHERHEKNRRISSLEAENNRLDSECQYLRENCRSQMEELNQECCELARLLTTKQQLLIMKTQEVTENQRKIKILSSQLKNCLQAWDKEKSPSRKRIISQTSQDSSPVYPFKMRKSAFE